MNRIRFPSQGRGTFRMTRDLGSIARMLASHSAKYNLGSLYTPAHPVAIQAVQQFVSHNPNHLGSWFSDKHPWATMRLEQEVVGAMIDLLGGNKRQLDGYVTSGGSEGNIFCLWAAKSYLATKTKEPVCLIHTALSHYSITKAARVTDTQAYEVPLHKKTWSMDPEKLARVIRRLCRDGVRGFIISLTHGYTTTGTADDISAIATVVRELQKQLHGAHFAVWVDAALNGLVAPFVFKQFQSLADPLIHGVVVDFHKFGGVPYGAGVVIIDKKLSTSITRPIPYLTEKDATLLGSRPGAAAAGCWAMMQHLGREGFASRATEQTANKEYFLSRMRALFPKVEITTSDGGVGVGIMFRGSKGHPALDAVSEKYWLHPAKLRSVVIYKFFFMPHVRRGIIDEFVRDVRNAL